MASLPLTSAVEIPYHILNMTLRKKILRACERYCDVTGLAEATVATKVRNDGKFFDNLRSGRGNGCTIDTYEDVMNWFKINTPKKSKRTK